MANTVEPGNNAPNFELPNANDSSGSGTVSMSDVIGDKGGIIMFTCNHCPYVVGSEPRIENIAEKARESGLGFVGINSNDPVKYESDSWDNMVKRASRGMSYPYLHDEDQTVAVSYGAERTPSSISFPRRARSFTEVGWMTLPETLRMHRPQIFQMQLMSY